MKNKAYKSYAWITIPLSIAAIIFSIMAICVSCPRELDLGFDYQGVIVGILSLLVTMLIGWQIYNLFMLKSEMEKRMEEILNDKLRKLNHIVTGYTKARLSNALFCKEEPESLDNIFDAIEDIIQGDGIDPENMALNCAIDKIHAYIQDSGNSSIKILRGKRNHYINLMKNIKHEDKDEIIEKLRNAIETDS
jgi:hypothetical protein